MYRSQRSSSGYSSQIGSLELCCSLLRSWVEIWCFYGDQHECVLLHKVEILDGYRGRTGMTSAHHTLQQSITEHRYTPSLQQSNNSERSFNPMRRDWMDAVWLFIWAICMLSPLVNLGISRIHRKAFTSSTISMKSGVRRCDEAWKPGGKW